MPTLLEASLQIHLLFPPFCLVEAFLRLLLLISEGVSVRDTHVVNTVCPLLPEVSDKKVALLLRDLWQKGTDSVHDMRVVNTDALTYQLN